MQIYVMKCQDMVKVGITGNMPRRLYAMQAGPWPVDLVGACDIPDEIDARELEREVHEALDEFHCRGEWFRIDQWCALTTVEYLAIAKHGVAASETACDLALALSWGDQPRSQELLGVLTSLGWEYRGKFSGDVDRLLWRAAAARGRPRQQPAC